MSVFNVYNNVPRESEFKFFLFFGQFIAVWPQTWIKWWKLSANPTQAVSPWGALEKTSKNIQTGPSSRVKKPGKRLRSIVPAITLGSPSVSNRIKTGDMIQFSFCLSVWYGKSLSLFSGSSNGLSFEQSRGKRCILPSNCYIVNFTIFSCLCYPLFISFVCCFIFFLLFLPFSHACVFVGIQEFLPS